MPDLAATGLVAAIDGGGTKTAGVIADGAGRVRRLTPSSGCNPHDGPGWRDALDAVLAQVPEGTPLALGMPGYGEVPRLDAAVQAHLAGRAGPLALLNDVALAMEGALAGGPGVLLLSGTGSMAMSRGPGGEARAGGWNDLIGDEGSAHWIGRAALARASGEIDGRHEATGFAPALVAQLGAPSHRFGLLDWVGGGAGGPDGGFDGGHDCGRARVASVARAVDALAADHAPARAILLAAAAELVALARTAARAVGLPGRFDWCAAGSVFRSATLANGVVAALGPAGPARLDALGGGLLRARRLAGAGPDDGWTARIAAALATDDETIMEGSDR